MGGDNVTISVIISRKTHDELLALMGKYPRLDICKIGRAAFRLALPKFKDPVAFIESLAADDDNENPLGGR